MCPCFLYLLIIKVLDIHPGQVGQGQSLLQRGQGARDTHIGNEGILVLVEKAQVLEEGPGVNPLLTTRVFDGGGYYHRGYPCSTQKDQAWYQPHYCQKR